MSLCSRVILAGCGSTPGARHMTLWFAAIHPIVTAKSWVSSVEFARRLGVKQPTAWAMKHKIVAVMARGEGEMRLAERVEMDDAYLGGRRSSGERPERTSSTICSRNPGA